MTSDSAEKEDEQERFEYDLANEAFEREAMSREDPRQIANEAFEREAMSREDPRPYEIVETAGVPALGGYINMSNSQLTALGDRIG